MKIACSILGFAVISASSLALAQTYDDAYRERRYRYEGPKKVDEFAANRGVQIGGRFGYMAGVGNVYSGVPLMDSADGALPVTLDVGMRLLPYLYVGAYGSWSHVLTTTHPIACPEGSRSCYSDHWRVGVEADVHFLPKSKLDPYVGFGFGYNIKITDTTGPRNVTVPGVGAVPADVRANVVDRGWEFANLTLGFTARVNKVFGIGPYVMVSANLFDVHEGNLTVSPPTGGPAITTGRPAVRSEAHGLGIIGIRAAINP